ncbi:MAG: PIN domain protein [Candidatus Omnitrophica bacterium]|nr:PIN domain protein [Candidatus Omnitrophota bacterium]MCA9439274.1 PIN domain protein [Candidatus Omnitrophota bacterium]
MNLGQVLRVYCDTSVFGGCFDEQYMAASEALLDRFREGEFRLVLSQVTLGELAMAPVEVQGALRSVPGHNREFVRISDESLELRNAYLEAGVVGPSSQRDALQIAVATVARVDLIVSWNFKHIVHFEKIDGYHEVNRLHGYPEVPIYSPLEVA